MNLPDKLIFEYFKKYGEEDAELISLCETFNDKIVLMPLSKNSIALKHYLSQKHGLSIAHFIDNDPLLNNTEFEGKQVFNFSSAQDHLIDKFIILSGMAATIDAISTELNNSGIKNYYCLYKPSFLIDKIQENFHCYNSTYNKLSDDLSRHTFINTIVYRLTQNVKLLQPVVRPSVNQYFEPDIYQVVSTDHFVDCGAYTGDTMEQLLCLTGGKIASYYGFEPFEDTFNTLKTTAVKHNININYLFNKAVTSKECLLKYQHLENSDSSNFRQNSSGSFTIKGIPLDTVLHEKEVTFIKMDIEGAEADALKGAKKIIQSQRPTLAISVYHKFADIWEIPTLIETFSVNYKYYLRHYSLTSSETILYCIPNVL